jgi:hypothetical protein
MMQTIYLKLNEALNATNTYSALYQVWTKVMNNLKKDIANVAWMPVTQELKDEYWAAVDYEQGSRDLGYL